jgi:hypothetical protein
VDRLRSNIRLFTSVGSCPVDVFYVSCNTLRRTEPTCTSCTKTVKAWSFGSSG